MGSRPSIKFDWVSAMDFCCEHHYGLQKDDSDGVAYYEDEIPCSICKSAINLDDEEDFERLIDVFDLGKLIYLCQQCRISDSTKLKKNIKEKELLLTSLADLFPKLIINNLLKYFQSEERFFINDGSIDSSVIGVI